MGLFMVVQTRTIAENEGSIELIEIPESFPNNVIENDSILILESKLRKLENKIIVTAQSILNLIAEQKTHASEIERLEDYYVSMRELVVSQNDRIDELEKKDSLTSTKLYDIIDYIERKEIQTSAKLDTIIENIEKKEEQISIKLDNIVKNAERKIMQISGNLDNPLKEIETNETKTQEKVENMINNVEEIETQTHNQLDSTTVNLESNENIEPDKLMQIGFKSIKENMDEELLDKLKYCDFQFFEKIILQLLSNMGYGKGEVINRTIHDRIDGFFNPDRFGFDRIYFRANMIKDNSPITTSMISDFIGSLELNGVNKGIFITTSYFQKNLKQALQNINKNIILIDGNNLGELMAEYNIELKTEKFFEIKSVDYDFFTKEF